MAKKRSGFSTSDRRKKGIQISSASRKPFFRSAGGLFALCSLLIVLVIGTFWPSVHCQFQFYDENDYLLANAHVNRGLTWANVCWAFTALGKSNWVPLTWLTHMMDFQVYGHNAWGHHLTNILIHAANVSLLFLLLQRMTGAVGRSFVLAALFAVHPLRVESVTWISERKDVVSFFFGMLALLAYVRYAEESQKAAGRHDRFYVLTLLLFVFSLMSKATLVTFPCLLLLLDYWPLRRTSDFKLDRANLRLVVEKIPFFLLIVPASIVAELAEQSGNSVILQPPLTLRLETALISYARYLGYMSWPVNLSPNYTYPKSWPAGELWLAAAVLAGLSTLVLVVYVRRPYFLVGWLWFLGTLVPVNGIIEQVGPQAMADRYTYIPMIGILLIVVWGINDMAESLRLRPQASLALASIVAVLLITVTRNDISYWRDGDSRWSRAVAVSRNNWTAYANLGTVLDTSNPDRSLDCFEKSVEINPDYVEAQRGLAFGLLRHGRYAEAIEHFRIAWIQNTDDPRSQWGWGIACYRAGHFNDALFHMQAAHAIAPGNASYMTSLAELLVGKQRFTEAIPVLKGLCAVQTNNPANFNNLGYALVKCGQLDAAIEAFQTARNIAPNRPDVEANLANAIKLKQQEENLRLSTNSAARVQSPAH